MLSNKCKKGRIFLLIGLGMLFLFLSSSQVLSLAQTVMLNGKEYTLSGGKWYVEDAGYRYEVVEDAITVKFKQGVSAKQMDEFNSSIGVAIIRKNRLGYYDLRLPSGYNPLRAAQQYIDSGLVESAEVGGYGIYFATPNDTLYSSQYHLSLPSDHDIDAPQGWDIEKGDSSIVISIIDSGVDIDHEDLSLNMWKNTADPVNGDDDDGNGYTDDYDGWDFSYGDGNPTRGIHGTCCAGIASAVMNNTTGVASLAGGWYSGTRGARIMPLGIGPSAPNYLLVDDAILYAVDMGADAISMSFGVSSTSAIDAAIDTAYAHGLVLVAASGNANGSVAYPARARHVIGVGAIDTLDAKASYSNYGDSLDVVAPSNSSGSPPSPGVYTTDYTGASGYVSGNYYRFGGTSAATPQVAGLSALLFSFDSTLTPDEVTEIICESADKVGNQTYSDWGSAPYGAWDDSLGYGRINVFKALLRAKGYGNITADVTWYNDITLTGDVTVNNGVTLTIKPGVTVKFATTDASSGGWDSNRSELIVQGKLIAEGTSSSRITFQSTNGGTTKDEWYGIVFRSNADDASSVKYANIKNARYAVYCDDASPDIEHNTITYSTIGVKGVTMGSGGSISYNTINNTTTAVSLSSNSSVPVRYNNLSSNVRSGYFTGTTSTVQYDTLDSNSNEGISLFSGSDVTFGHNRIVGNTGWGMWLWSGSDPVMRGSAGYNNINNNGNSEIYCQSNSKPQLGDDAAGLPGHNDIYDDTGYAIYTDTFIKAEKNWWNSTDYSTIRSYMFPADSVDFSPWDNSSNTKPVLVAGSDPVLEDMRAGIEAEESEDYRNAIGAYQRVLQDPESRWTREALGGLHRSTFALREDLGEFRELMKHIAGQTKDAGIKAKAEELARKALVADGRYEEAIGEYQAVVDEGGEDALSAMVHIGEISLYQLKEVSRAQAILTEVVAQAPESPEAFAARMALDDADAMPNLEPEAPQPGSAEKVLQPRSIVLAPNYPNPFNPQTTLSFVLPGVMRVRLVVYNILGQEVRVLVDGVRLPGTHTVLWDGRDAQGIAVGSGLYFARLEAAEAVHTRKLLLLR